MHYNETSNFKEMYVNYIYSSAIPENKNKKMSSQAMAMVMYRFYPGLVQVAFVVIMAIAIIVITGSNINVYFREKREKQARTNVTNSENKGLIQPRQFGY